VAIPGAGAAVEHAPAGERLQRVEDLGRITRSGPVVFVDDLVEHAHGLAVDFERSRNYLHLQAALW